MIEVGQTLYYVPYRSSAGAKSVVISKVGRKWAEIGYDGRIDIETLVVDGGKYSSPARCYLSREQYDDERKLALVWDRFRTEVQSNFGVPDGVTIEMIREARVALGIET